MRSKTLAIPMFIGALFSAGLYADENKSAYVYLTCVISNTLDEKSGTTSPTTGAHGLIVKAGKDGDIRIESDKFGEVYVGTVNETTYYGTVNFSLQGEGLGVRDWVEISRITGEYKMVSGLTACQV